MARFIKLSGKRKALLEAGIAIMLIILFIGALNSITYASRTPIITTEDIWKNADKVNVVFRVKNETFITSIVYPLKDIATFYNNRLYISTPPPTDIENARFASITINLYNLNMTWNDLISYGVNYVKAFVYIHNTTALTADILLIGLGAVDSPTSRVMSGGLVDGYAMPIVPWRDYWNKYYTSIMGNGILEKTLYLEKSVDTGTLAVTVMANSLGSTRLGFFITFPLVFLTDYIVVELEVYAVSEKPVLKAITEPIYSFFAALYALLLAVVNRIKQYVVSAFSGFAAQFTMTGLIGDPVIALIVVLFVLTVLFLVARRRR